MEADAEKLGTLSLGALANELLLFRALDSLLRSGKFENLGSLVKVLFDVKRAHFGLSMRLQGSAIV